MGSMKNMENVYSVQNARLLVDLGRLGRNEGPDTYQSYHHSKHPRNGMHSV